MKEKTTQATDFSFFSPEGKEKTEASAYIATPSNLVADNLSKANDRLGLATPEPDGSFSIDYNNLFLKAKSEVLACLKPSTSKALDIFGSRISPRDRTASISVADFMKARGIKDRKQAVKELTEAGTVATETLITYDKSQLTKTQISFYDKKGIEVFLGSFLLAEHFQIIKGVASLVYSPKYSKLALQLPPMLYHRELARLNDKRNPASYYLGRKLTERMNMERRNSKGRKLSAAATTLSIDSLLLAAKNAIPSEAEVARSNRAFKKRIVDRLECDLDALSEIGRWEYRKTAKDGGEVISRSEAGALPFQLWKELNIRFTFIGYLEELERREEVARSYNNLPNTSNGGAPAIDV